MFTWRSLSAPSKVIALIITIVLVGTTVYLIDRYVYGTITIKTPLAGAQIDLQNDTIEYAAPHTYTLKPGNWVFTVTANGYLDRTIQTKVYPFWHRTVTVALDKDLSFENAFFRIEYHYETQSYFIVPIIPITVEDSTQNQLASQWNVYQDHAQQALQYIRKQGIDPHSLRIDWWLQDYWPKGKKISY